jgi:hypothetical protein
VWNLKFEGIDHITHEGPDDADKCRDLDALLGRFKSQSDRRCLQVGINHPYTDKHAHHFVSIDKYDKNPQIDVRRDLADSGFADSAFDFIICNAILEHVKNPFECGHELARIADHGCEIWCEVPFAQPFHPTKTWNYDQGFLLDQGGDESLPADENHGGDYWRFTPQGIALILSGFAVKRIYIIGAGGIAFHGVKP